MARDLAQKDSSRRTRIYDELLEKILFGRLQPDTRIVESRLCEDLGVSRTPLREALCRLEQEGYVVSKPNRGFSVSPLSQREIRELYPIIGTLEALALTTAGLAVVECVDVLEAINSKFLAAAKTPEKAIKFDTQFHHCILDCCPNKYLVNLLQELRNRAERYERFFLAETHVIKTSAREHQDLINFLKEENIEQAAECLNANWCSCIDWMVQALD